MIGTRMIRTGRMNTDLFFVPKNYRSFIKFIISDKLRQQLLSVIIRPVQIIRIPIPGVDKKTSEHLCCAHQPEIRWFLIVQSAKDIFTP
ncbi:MAG: hypothetical protein ABI402_03385 [Ferruginibacter sp.]